MGYRVAHPDALEFEERPHREDEPPRHAADLTTVLGLERSRARLWRYPPGTRGRRHADRVQEEVFVVLAGEPTMYLGEPPERHELAAGAVVAVQPGTALQVRNESDQEATLFIYGAPPEQAGADFLADVP
ncbi:MAG: cupin domain-containing protein [Actinomycetota bacterium]|nr:cupin domain-containing protein [Actinomycetota bacterium]